MNKVEHIDSISERLKPGVNIVGDTVPPGMQRFVTFLRIKNLSDKRNFIRISSIHEDTKAIKRKYLTAVEPNDVEDFPNEMPVNGDSFLFRIDSMTRLHIEADYDAFVFVKY